MDFIPGLTNPLPHEDTNDLRYPTYMRKFREYWFAVPPFTTHSQSPRCARHWLVRPALIKFVKHPTQRCRWLAESGLPLRLFKLPSTPRKSSCSHAVLWHGPDTSPRKVTLYQTRSAKHEKKRRFQNNTRCRPQQKIAQSTRQRGQHEDGYMSIALRREYTQDQKTPATSPVRTVSLYLLDEPTSLCATSPRHFCLLTSTPLWKIGQTHLPTFHGCRLTLSFVMNHFISQPQMYKHCELSLELRRHLLD